MTAGPHPGGDWARLSPLSPVAKGARVVVAFGLVFGRQAGQPGGLPWGFEAAAAALAVAGGVVSWVVTRWRIDGTDLQLETGLLRRQSLRVPLGRVQAVDVVRPLPARILGLAELRLVLAGGGAGKARLSYLRDEKVDAVRARLLALAHGLAPETPVAPERPLMTMVNSRLVVATALGGPAGALALTATGAVLAAVLAPRLVAGLLVTLLGLVITLVSISLRRVNTEYGFTLAESPDGLRLRSGLLQTRAETIPYGRIQGVRLVEPLLWRPLGWCRLEVDVAQQREREPGQEEDRRLGRALLPVGTRAEADRLLAHVVPGASTRPPAGSRPPARARWKAPLSWHLLAAWHDERYLVTRTGRLQARTVVLPLAKMQSAHWRQGPLQRRLGLATVQVDTAGRRWRAQARDRDRDEAGRLVWAVPDLARSARADPAPVASER